MEGIGKSLAVGGNMITTALPAKVRLSIWIPTTIKV